MTQNIFKKIIFLSLVIFVFCGAGTVSASNPTIKYGLSKTGDKAGLKDAVKGATDVPSLVGAVINAVLGLMGIIFFFIIFYSGFRWMTARGNSDAIEKSKDAILSAAIGLVIILAAYAITNFVFDNLTSPDQTTTPTTI
jgi:hypothetical protein